MKMIRKIFLWNHMKKLPTIRIIPAIKISWRSPFQLTKAFVSARKHYFLSYFRSPCSWGWTWPCISGTGVESCPWAAAEVCPCHLWQCSYQLAKAFVSARKHYFLSYFCSPCSWGWTWPCISGTWAESRPWAAGAAGPCPSPVGAGPGPRTGARTCRLSLRPAEEDKAWMAVTTASDSERVTRQSADPLKLGLEHQDWT